MAPRVVVPPEPGPQKGGTLAVDTVESSSVWRGIGDTLPHACYDGWVYLRVYLTYTEHDAETWGLK
jgi:hypothetical protein